MTNKIFRAEVSFITMLRLDYLIYFLMSLTNLVGCQASEPLEREGMNSFGMELAPKDRPESEEAEETGGEGGLMIIAQPSMDMEVEMERIDMGEMEVDIEPLQVLDLPESGILELKAQVNELKSHLILISNPNQVDALIGQVSPEAFTDPNADLTLDAPLSTCLVQRRLRGGETCSLVIRHQPALGGRAFQVSIPYTIATLEETLNLQLMSIGETPAVVSVENLPSAGYFEFSGPALEVDELTVRLINTGVADARDLYLTGIDDPEGEEMPLPFMVNETESTCQTLESLPTGETCDWVIYKELTLAYNIDSFIVHYHNGAREDSFGVGIRSHGDAPAQLIVNNLPTANYFELRGVIGDTVTETIEVRNIGNGPALELGLSTTPDPDFNPRELPVDLNQDSGCLMIERLGPNEVCAFNISKTLRRGINIDSLIVNYFNGISDDELSVGIRVIGETPARLELVDVPSEGYRLASRVGETATLRITIQNVGSAPAGELTPLGIEDPDGELMDLPVTIEPTSTCDDGILLEPNETCTYIVSNTPERAPYTSISNMRVRYRAGEGEEAFLSIGLRIMGIE